MRNVDQMIDEALEAEEKELLRSIGEETGFIERTLGTLDQRVLWVAGLMMVIQSIAFLAGAWATWMFFEANDAVTQLRWGLPAAVLLMSLMINSRWPAIHASGDARAEADRAPDRAHSRPDRQRSEFHGVRGSRLCVGPRRKQTADAVAKRLFREPLYSAADSSPRGSIRQADKSDRTTHHLRRRRPSASDRRRECDAVRTEPLHRTADPTANCIAPS